MPLFPNSVALKREYLEQLKIFKKASSRERKVFKRLGLTTGLSVIDELMFNEIKAYHHRITGSVKPLDSGALLRFLIRCFYADYIDPSLLDQV